MVQAWVIGLVLLVLSHITIAVSGYGLAKHGANKASAAYKASVAFVVIAAATFLIALPLFRMPSRPAELSLPPMMPSPVPMRM